MEEVYDTRDGDGNRLKKTRAAVVGESVTLEWRFSLSVSWSDLRIT